MNYGLQFYKLSSTRMEIRFSTSLILNMEHCCGEGNIACLWIALPVLALYVGIERPKPSLHWQRNSITYSRGDSAAHKSPALIWCIAPLPPSKLHHSWPTSTCSVLTHNPFYILYLCFILEVCWSFIQISLWSISQVQNNSTSNIDIK